MPPTPPLGLAHRWLSQRIAALETQCEVPPLLRHASRCLTNNESRRWHKRAALILAKGGRYAPR